jgi:endonuclease/exonuclease/phosphatase family metal-dependent hydrolase
MGDFNLSTHEDSEALWSEHYYASTSVPYISFPGGNTHTPKRIDYALIPKHYRFTSIAVSDDGLSDHRALTVSIEPSLDS